MIRDQPMKTVSFVMTILVVSPWADFDWSNALADGVARAGGTNKFPGVCALAARLARRAK